MTSESQPPLDQNLNTAVENSTGTSASIHVASSKSSDKSLSPVQLAMRRAVHGFVAAAILTFILVSLPYPNLKPAFFNRFDEFFTRVNLWGEDIGMQIAPFAHSTLSPILGSIEYSQPNRIFVVEIDNVSCAHIQIECDYVLQTPPELVLLALEYMRDLSNAPGVIVSDLYVDWSALNKQTKDRFQKLLSRPNSAQIIMPLRVDQQFPNTDSVHVSISHKISLPEYEVNNVILALPLASAQNDGTVRSYKKVINVSNTDVGGEEWIKTLPYAAVAALKAGLSANDQSQAIAVSEEELPPRFVYTIFPCQFGRFADCNDALSAPLSGSVTVLQLSTILKEPLSPRLFENSVVILGSTIIGDDIHATPVGAMPGYGVLANAIRASFDSRLLVKQKLPSFSDFLSTILTKLVFVAIATVVFFIFWIFWFRFLALAQSSSLPRFVYQILAISVFGFLLLAALSISALCIFCFSVFLIPTIEAQINVIPLKSSYDLVTPLVALSLEAIFEVVKAATGDESETSNQHEIVIETNKPQREGS